MAISLVRLAALLYVVACLTCQAAGQLVVVQEPRIDSISGCDPAGPATINCNMVGSDALLTLVGDGLDPSSQLVYVGSSTKCAPSGGNSTHMVCAISTYSSYNMSANVPLPIAVLDLSTGVLVQAPATVTATFTVYPPLVITSVSGCDDYGIPLWTYNCSTSSSILTLTGSGFYNGPQAYAPYFQFYFPVEDQTWTGQTGLYNWYGGAKVLSDTLMTISLSDIATNNGRKLQNTGLLCITPQRGLVIMAPNPVCLTFNVTDSNSVQGPANNASSPVITGVSGCAMNYNNATYGCLRNDLTITGSGFPARGVVITVGDVRCGQYGAALTPPDKIICYFPRQWNGAATGQLVPVIIQDLNYGIVSAPFYGVSFGELNVPVIAGIAGCQGSGLITTLCSADTDAITLTGVGFDTPDTLGWSVSFGNIAKPMWNYYVPTIQTDSSVILALNVSSDLVNSLKQAAAGLRANNSIPVWFSKMDAVISNPVYITLAPVYINVTRLDGCEMRTDFLINDCTPGVSVLSVYATNIYPPLSITVGGVVCTQVDVLSSFVSCVLGAPESFLPSVAYDVVIVQGLSEVVIPVAVQFTAGPTIQTISSAVCASDYLSLTSLHALDCTAGDIITLVGSFFSYTPQLQVRMLDDSGTVLALCEDVTLLTSWSLQCTLPALNATQAVAVLGRNINVLVYENATSASNPLATVLYRAPTSVGVSGVSGCGGVDSTGRGTSGCVTSDVITVAGENFVLPLGGQLQVVVYELSTQVVYQCQLPTIVSPTLLTCRLPYIALLVNELELPLRVQLSATKLSNWFVGVGYSEGLSSPSQAAGGSTDWRAAFVAVTVLLGTVLLMMVVLVVVVCRQARSGQGNGKLVDTSEYRSESSRNSSSDYVQKSSQWPSVEMH